jgi:hypothetical protein
MKQFVILFRQGPHLFTEAGRARRQAAIITWARELNARGHRLEPRSLDPSFTRPGIEVTEDDYGKWPVSALLFIGAHDLHEATTIAATHPAKDYNVSMEVRPWTPTGTPAWLQRSA